MSFQLSSYIKTVSNLIECPDYKREEKYSLEMAMLAILKRLSFCLNNMSESDMKMSDGS